MSTQEETTFETLPAAESSDTAQGPEPVLCVGLTLSEAEGLYGWLMKPANDGSTALDDQLVSRAVAKMREAIDSLRTAIKLRRDLQEAGLASDHLTDEQLRELAQKLAQSATPSLAA
jgi:hypothetical protein